MEKQNGENKKKDKKPASQSPFLQEEIADLIPGRKEAKEEKKINVSFETALENSGGNELNAAQDYKNKEKIDIPDPGSAKEVVQADQFNFFKRNFTLLIKLAILFLVLAVILAAGAFGMSQYEKYYQKITLEEILPAGASLVLKVTIDPDSRQFALLEENMQRFPGYELFKKGIDKTGEGKTLSQAFQDKLKDLNLDFQQDLKPVLGENAYFIVPDISPLGENLQNRILLSAGKVKDSISNMAFSANSTDGQIAVEEEGKVGPRVLGETIDNLAKIAMPAESSGNPVKSLDFIAASEIKDLKKAKEVLEKMKKDNKYEINERKFGGFSYFQVKAKNTENQSDAGKYFKVQETFNAILGKNWIMASREDDIKDIIRRTKENLSISGLFSKKSHSSLAEDADYQRVIDNLNKVGEENLLTLYYKINFNEFFGKRDCAGAADCESITKYIKYPEDIIAGIMLKMDSQGAVIKTTSNNLASGSLSGKSLKDGLAAKIPQKIDGRWTDLFFEHTGIKDAYYNFKKNNLTDKGLEVWNNALTAINQKIGIDLERDFIDQIDGGLAVAVFSAKDLEPQGALIAEVKDSGRMLDSMKKIVELLKINAAKIYSAGTLSALPQLEQSISAEQKAKITEAEKSNKEIYDKIMQSQIAETDTSYGKIYSYKLPVPEGGFINGLSFDFSVENNLFILGSHYGAVESLLREIKEGTEKKLADNDFFKKAMIYSFPDGYDNTFVYIPGIWDAIEYYINKERMASIASLASYCDSLKDKAQAPSYCASPPSSSGSDGEENFAIGSIFRTLKIVNFSKALKDNFSRSFIFVNVEELPKDEKDRAAKILDRM